MRRKAMITKIARQDAYHDVRDRLVGMIGYASEIDTKPNRWYACSFESDREHNTAVLGQPEILTQDFYFYKVKVKWLGPPKY